MEKPKVITICGSSRFCQEMAVLKWIMERDEGAIVVGLHLLPWWYTDAADHLGEVEGVADHFNTLHLRKIDISDEVFVTNIEGYIGTDTEREINYAKEKGIPIRWWTNDPLGSKVSKIIAEAKENCKKKYFA